MTDSHTSTAAVLVTGGIHELVDAPLASAHYSADMAPTNRAHRKWAAKDMAALWISMAACVPTYQLASSLITEGMNWTQAIITIFLGNVIVLIPMVLNAHAGTKYGVSFPVLCRASFGVKGANVPAMLRAAVACGWFGIQTWIGALALDTLMTAAWSGWTGVSGHVAIAFAAFWGIQVLIIFKGTEGIKALESWSAPLLLAGGALLLLWAIRNGGGLGNVLSQSMKLQKGTADFWKLFPAALTANVGYWATLSLNIPDFTRYARSQRSQVLGQALGLPTTMTAFAFIGVAVTSATIVIFGEAIWDPVVLVSKIGGTITIIFAALVVLAAQLTTNMAANVVSPSNDFSNLSPKRISYVTGGLITAVLGIVMMPWKLYSDAAAYIFTWLLGYSSLMGALGGILIVDYWIIRRQQLNTDDLFKKEGAYTYGSGVNWRAIMALVLAILPVVPGFTRAVSTPGGSVADPGLFDQIYSYAWFVTFFLSGLFYYALMRGAAANAKNR